MCLKIIYSETIIGLLCTPECHCQADEQEGTRRKVNGMAQWKAETAVRERRERAEDKAEEWCCLLHLEARGPLVTLVSQVRKGVRAKLGQ